MVGDGDVEQHCVVGGGQTAHDGLAIQNGGLQSSGANALAVGHGECSGAGQTARDVVDAAADAVRGRRSGRRRRVGGFQRAALVEFVLVDGPDGAFHVFDAHETLVEAEVVSYGVLRGGRTRR